MNLKAASKKILSEKNIVADEKPASNNDLIVLVDQDDNAIGTADKLYVHQQGLLHRAFSILLFRKKNNQLETLLQQRAFDKYHCGGLWSNACCSHAKPNEELLQTAYHKLYQELNIKTEIKEIGKFTYRANLNNQLIENEIDHLFIGFYDADDINPNPEEVANYQWENIDILFSRIEHEKMRYTPWLKQALSISIALLPNI